MTLVVADCAVCGKRDFTLVYPRTVRDGDDPALYFSSSRERVGYLDIVRCRSCGLLMTNPRDDDATVARVYAGLRDAAYDGEDENRSRTARAYLQLIDRYVPKRGRLLDVGCATGVFVAEASKAGWSVTGVEASRWAIQRARERSPQATLVEGLLEEVKLAEGAFDVVTLWDVLEHVRSPKETLAHARKWLAPGGWLFLNLPNADSLVARALGRRWVLLLREHFWFFDPRTMGAVLQASGFELVTTQPNLVNFSLSNVLKRVSQYPGATGQLAARAGRMSGLKHLSVRFPIGEMRVVARVI